MLSILKVVSGSEESETPTSVALKLNKLVPNVARTMNRLSEMGVLESERKGKTKHYRVPTHQVEEVKSIIEQAMGGGVSDARSRLTESFYQNLLYSSLRKFVPNGWEVSVNPKLHDNAALSLDLGVSDGTGLIAGVELNMGPPGQHLYALIGRTVVGISDSLKVLILVVLTTHAKNYGFLKRIRKMDSQPRFGVILREMPVQSETTFAESTAKDIINVIKSSR
jgi:hypothetical protein